MKTACCSTLNDLYLPGFIVFFYSLLKHNPWFDYPYYIFNWGELSSESVIKLKKIYPNFRFCDIQNEDYNNVSYSTVWRTWNINCINRFEIFTLEEYDRIVFFDADMLVLDDISYLFNVNVDFGAVEITPGTEMDHPGRYDKNIKSFDGGLMVISSKYLNAETKKCLIDIARQKNWSSDEPILNVFFDKTKTTFLPREYNLLSQEFNEHNIKKAKILQFVGHKKPWFPGILTDRYDESVTRDINNSLLLIRIDLMYKSYYNKAYEHFGV